MVRKRKGIRVRKGVRIRYPAGGGLVQPDVLTLGASIPSPTISAGATTQPSAQALGASLPIRTVIGSAAIAPDVLEFGASIPSPTISAGATVQPSAQILGASLPARTVIGEAAIAPSVLEMAASIPAYSIVLQGLVVANVLELTATIPGATVIGGSLHQANVLRGAFSIPGYGIITGAAALVLPDPLVLSASIPSIMITGGARVEPGVLDLTLEIPAASVAASALVEAGVAELRFSIPARQVSGGADFSASTISARIAIPTYSIQTDISVAVFANVLNLAASILPPIISAFGDALVQPSYLRMEISIPSYIVSILGEVPTAAVIEVFFKNVAREIEMGRGYMKPRSLPKQPWESIIYKINATKAVPSGIFVIGAEIVITDSTGQDKTSDMLDGIPSIDSPCVYPQIKDGADGERYNLSARLYLSNGEKLEDDLKIVVSEKKYTN